MGIRLVRFINILVAALLAGTSFGIWMGFDPSGFSPATYLEQQQHLVASLFGLMVTLVVAATLVTLLSAFMHRKDKAAFIALLAAAALFALCLVISRFGNLPIQTEMMNWQAGSLPENWADLRDRWWTLHIYRTLAELLALVLVAWTGSKAVPPVAPA